MTATTAKIVLVTGANKGIGFEISRQLGHTGATVLMGARSAATGEAAVSKLRAEGMDARYVEVDLLRTETIAAAATWVQKEFGRLDVLVNNAGITDRGDGSPSAADVDAVTRTLETNFVGALRVTQAMLPLVRVSAAGRIVNVSSGLGSLTWQGDAKSPYAAVKYMGYSASKAALNMLTVQLAYELRATPVKVNSSDPGYTATDLNGHSGHQTVQEGAAETVRLALLEEDGPTGGFFSTAGPEPW